MLVSPLKYGESVTYEVYFKWGVIMPRAGNAVITFNKNTSLSNAVSQYMLQFKTAAFFDNFYKMRDTLVCYYNTDNKIVFSEKYTNEGDYYSIDRLTFTYNENKTNIHSYRATPKRVKIDTVLTVVDDYVTDLLGSFFYVRCLDRKNLRSGDIFPFTVALGRDLVKIQLCYQNQAIVERGNVKYNTLYFKINIYDEVFTTTTTSAELWMGNDDNFLPIKIRSKLKVGYVEIYYLNSSSLAYPMTCRIEMK